MTTTSSSRAAQKLASLRGTERTINGRPHGPVTVSVASTDGPGAELTVENSDGAWECVVDEDGIVEHVAAADGGGVPHWVAKLLENLGFREVPDSPVQL